MSSSKKSGNGQPVARGFSVHPKLFVFFDKRTGTPRFQLRARHEGTLPVEQAVSLLAVQCIARQKMPREFGILVGTDEDLVSGLVGRTISPQKVVVRQHSRSSQRWRAHRGAIAFHV